MASIRHIALALPLVGLLAGDAAAKERGYPLNGRVFNNSDKPVTIWIEGRTSTVPAGSSTPRKGTDVDFVQDSCGRWFKIGPRNVYVSKDGFVLNAKCIVDAPGTNCGGFQGVWPL